MYQAGQTATVLDDAGNTIGDITSNADGSYEFTPVANWNGYVPTIDYKLVDDSGNPDNFDPSTLDIVVTPVNDLPIAEDDTGTAPYGTPVVVDVLDNDTDPDRR